MVAITVILAAVIGTFVLGLGDQIGDTAPQASFDVDNATADTSNGVSLTLAKTGGQDLDARDLVLSVDGSRTNTSIESGLGSNTWQTGQSVSFTDETDGTPSYSPGERVTVRLIHDPSGNAIYSTTLTAE
jgi:FlaG/FlaF family flagellin (archaellin)